MRVIEYYEFNRDDFCGVCVCAFAFVLFCVRVCVCVCVFEYWCMVSGTVCVRVRVCALLGHH